MINRAFLKSVSILFSAQGVLSMSLLLIGIITARLLGPEGRGVYSLFFVIVGFGISFFNLGISQSNTYYFAKTKNTELFANALFIGLIILAMATGAAMVFGQLSDISLPLTMLVLCFFATLMQTFLSGIVLGGRYFSQYSIIQFTYGFILLAVTVVMIPIENTREMAVELRTFGALAASLFVLVYLRHLLGPVKLMPNLSLLKKQMRFGLHNWVQNLIGQVNYRVYILGLAYALGDRAVGIFSVALLIIELVRFVPDSLGTLLFPELASIDEKTKRESLISQALRIIILITMCGGGVVYFVLPIALPLIFGNEYQDSVLLAQIMIIGAVIGSLYQTLTRFFSAINKQIYSILSGAIGMVIGAPFLVVGIQSYGLVGAAMAFAIVQSCIGISLFSYFVRETNLGLWEIIKYRQKDFTFTA